MTFTAIVPGEEELGHQKRCGKCGEWWPWPDEDWWFHYRSHGRLVVHSQCRACASESKNRRRAVA